MKPSVLLVLPSEASREGLGKALSEQPDILVDSARSLDSALELMNERSFDAVVFEGVAEEDLKRLAAAARGSPGTLLVALAGEAPSGAWPQDAIVLRRAERDGDTANLVAAAAMGAVAVRKNGRADRPASGAFREAIDSSADFIVIVGSDHRIRFINRALALFLNTDSDKASGRKAEEFFPPSVISEFEQALDRVFGTGECVRTEDTLELPGGMVWLDLEMIPLAIVDGKPTMVLARAKDVTHERLQSERLRRLNRVYSMGSGIHSAIIEAKTEDELLGRVCKTALELGMFSNVWVWLADEKKHRLVCGGQAGETPLDKELPSEDDRAMQNPCFAAAMENRTFVCNDVLTDDRLKSWWPSIEKTGMRSMIAIPLRDGKNILGIIHVASAEKGYFDKEEVGLLETISDQISSAVVSLRILDAKARAEADLACTRHTLEAAFDASPMPIVVLDTKGSVQMWNYAAQRVFGWSKEEVVGRFNPLIPASEVDDFKRLLEGLLGGMNLMGLETKRMRKDGVMIDVAISTATTKDEHGNVTGVMGVIEDVTERVRARKALQDSQERLMRLTDNSPDIIFRLELHPEPRFVFANPATERILGYSREEFFADPWLLVRMTGEEHRGNLMAVLENPELTREALTIRVTRKDGKDIWCEARMVGVRGPEGQIDAIEGTVRDVTDTMRAVEALERRNRALELARIKMFAYLDFVNHDMANILTPVLSYAQLLADSVKDNPQAHTMAGRIADETLRASTFITNVRRISSIEKLTDTKAEPIELREAVRMAVEMAVRMVPEKKAEVTYQVPGDREVLVPGKGYLEDVLQAVATNSLIHSKSDQAELEISLSAAPMNDNENYWLLSMADHGPGIPDETKRTLMSEVFDPSEATRRAIIPSVKFMSLIVEALGGEFWLADRVEGDPGSGLKVMIMLPDASSKAREVRLGERIRTS